MCQPVTRAARVSESPRRSSAGRAHQPPRLAMVESAIAPPQQRTAACRQTRYDRADLRVKYQHIDRDGSPRIAAAKWGGLVVLATNAIDSGSIRCSVVRRFSKGRLGSIAVTDRLRHGGFAERGRLISGIRSELRWVDLNSRSIFFFKNLSNFACQAPEPPKALSSNNIHLAC